MRAPADAVLVLYKKIAFAVGTSPERHARKDKIVHPGGHLCHQQAKNDWTHPKADESQTST
jgi:hypothetical protein